jgi:hypothetical protein
MEKLVELARVLLRDPPPPEAVQELATLSPLHQWAVVRTVVNYDRRIILKEWLSEWAKQTEIVKWGLHHLTAELAQGVSTPEWAEVKRLQQELQTQPVEVSDGSVSRD